MRVITKCDPKNTIVQKRFKNDVNINTIVERARVQGLPQATSKGFFGDFTGIDFIGMQNTVARATEGFMALPARIRARFHNSAQNLIEFLEDKENIDEAIKLGLIPMPEEKVKAPEEVKKEPATPAQGTAST